MNEFSNSGLTIFLWFVSLIVLAVGIVVAMKLWYGYLPIAKVEDGKLNINTEPQIEENELEHKITIARKKYSIEIKDFDPEGGATWATLLNDFYNALKGLGYVFNEETNKKFEDLIGDVYDS